MAAEYHPFASGEWGLAFLPRKGVWGCVYGEGSNFKVTDNHTASNQGKMRYFSVFHPNEVYFFPPKKKSPFSIYWRQGISPSWILGLLLSWIVMQSHVLTWTKGITPPPDSFAVTAPERWCYTAGTSLPSTLTPTTATPSPQPPAWVSKAAEVQTSVSFVCQQPLTEGHLHLCLQLTLLPPALLPAPTRTHLPLQEHPTCLLGREDLTPALTLLPHCGISNKIFTNTHT